MTDRPPERQGPPDGARDAERRANRGAALLLAGFLAAVLVSAWPLTALKIDNSMELWFYEHDPGLVDYRRGLDVFGEWDWIAVAVRPRAGMYDTAFLGELQQATEALEALPDVRRVISLVNAKVTIDRDDVLEFRPLFEGTGLGPVERRALETNPVYRDVLFRPGAQDTTQILIQDANRFGESDARRIALIDEIRAIVAGLATVESFAIVGTPTLNAELNRSSRRDMLVFYPLVSALLLLIAWCLFRNLRDLLAIFVPVVGTVLLCVGAMLWSGHALNMVTIMMPAVLIAVLMASAVHFVNTFHGFRRERPHDTVEAALRRTRRTLWRPYLGTTLTTGIGFASLTSADTLPISLLAIFGAAALGLMFCFSFTVLPALLRLLEAGRAARSTAAAGIDARSWRTIPLALVGVAIRHPGRTTLAWAALALACGTGLVQLQADSDYVHMFRDDTRVQADYDDIQAWGYGASTLNITLQVPGGVQDPATFAALMELERRVQTLPQVTRTLGLVDVLAEVDRATASGPPPERRALAGYTREQLAQLILVAELSGNDNLSDLLSFTHEDTRLFVFTHYLSGQGNRDLVHAIRQHLDETLPAHVRARVTGVPALWANQDRYLFASQKLSFLYVSIAIFVALLLLTRSLTLTVIGVVVNVLPVAMMLGVMAWLGVRIDIATTLIGGLALGLAVDDTIHMLWRYTSELALGHAPREAIVGAARHTGRALLLTTLMLAGGFLVMATSDFLPTVNFGLFTALTVVLALLCDLLLLPSLLLLCHRPLRALARLREASGS